MRRTNRIESKTDGVLFICTFTLFFQILKLILFPSALSDEKVDTVCRTTHYWARKFTHPPTCVRSESIYVHVAVRPLRVQIKPDYNIPPVAISIIFLIPYFSFKKITRPKGQRSDGSFRPSPAGEHPGHRLSHFAEYRPSGCATSNTPNSLAAVKWTYSSRHRNNQILGKCIFPLQLLTVPSGSQRLVSRLVTLNNTQAIGQSFDRWLHVTSKDASTLKGLIGRPMRWSGRTNVSWAQVFSFWKVLSISNQMMYCVGVPTLQDNPPHF